MIFINLHLSESKHIAMSSKILQNETIRDFYLRHDITPTNELGHFNISFIEDLDNCVIEPIPFIRRSYYKVSLLKTKYIIQIKHIPLKNKP